MLINMKEMLAVADKNEFAVPAFNIGSEAILKGVVESANEKNAPVILAIHPTELEFLGDSFIKTCIEEANKSRVPMVIHLDHGGKFEEVLRAIRCGFTSVMIDASHMSYEDNIAITKKVVEVAHPYRLRRSWAQSEQRASHTKAAQAALSIPTRHRRKTLSKRPALIRLRLQSVQRTEFIRRT